MSFNQLTQLHLFPYSTRCLKITEKVSFNIASEASYVYILSGQKLIKNAQNGPFWRVFRKTKACGQTVSFNRTKIGGKCQNSKNQMRHFGRFSNNVSKAKGGTSTLVQMLI